MRTWAILVLVALPACNAPRGTKPGTDGDTDATDSTHPDSGGRDTSDGRPWNVVMVLADDQGPGLMWAMPTVSERLVPESVQFTNAYVTVPMCCPMRASFLSGGWYPRNTGVLTNGAPMGGVTAFIDTDTLATRLQQAGVATGIFGKYLNEYEYAAAPYVAPGWDAWYVAGVGDGAYDQALIEGSSDATSSSTGTEIGTGGEHVTPWLADRILDFVDEHDDGPFFVYFAPLSPHLAGNPETEDLSLYQDYSPRPPSYNEADVSDKPAWLQAQPLIDDTRAAALDENARTMLRNLASLDRAVGAIADGLEARGVLDHTLFIYTSDNGYMNGEHRVAMKGLPYEESVHVPLFMRVPGVDGRDDTRLVQANTDLAATVMQIFDVPAMGEGLPLLDALADPTLPTRDHVYLDNYTTGAPVWAGIATEKYKYIQWGTGETELYDLVADHDEMRSLDDAPPPDAQLAAWDTWVDEHRGLAITTTDLAPAQLGVPYTAQIAHWGGEEPVVFSFDTGTLPPGITLGGGGVLAGVPTVAGTYAFTVWARDASASAWTGRAQGFNQALTLTVGPPDAAPRAMRMTDTRARVEIHTRPGVTVAVRASPEPTMEGLRRVSAPVVAGADGRAVVLLDGLRTDRTWYWVGYLDGVPSVHGVVPEPAKP